MGGWGLGVGKPSQDRVCPDEAARQLTAVRLSSIRLVIL